LSSTKEKEEYDDDDDDDDDSGETWGTCSLSSTTSHSRSSGSRIPPSDDLRWCTMTEL